ncbi:MAG TPA: DUF1772 domain-containing protein [Ktedonobacterales bacterium]|nr:DUF1772 domain-containing protein [Ktedonobacterales bacterium]
MEAFAELAAVLCAGLFAGSALYESLVASRTTLALDDPAARFARGFRASGAFQAPLVLVGVATSVTAAVLGGTYLWALGALLMSLVVVITGVFVFPVNARLLRPDPSPGDGARRGLVVRWYRLHAVRGLIALTAASLFLLVLVHAG